MKTSRSPLFFILAKPTSKRWMIWFDWLRITIINIRRRRRRSLFLFSFRVLHVFFSKNIIKIVDFWSHSFIKHHWWKLHTSENSIGKKLIFFPDSQCVIMVGKEEEAMDESKQDINSWLYTAVSTAAAKTNIVCNILHFRKKIFLAQKTRIQDTAVIYVFGIETTLKILQVSKQIGHY